MRRFVAAAAAACVVVTPGLAVDYRACAAPANSDTLNPYIKCAVEMLSKERALGGYNLDRSFTQDLKYGAGGTDVIPASRAHGVDPKTGRDRGPPYNPQGLNPSMCVAGVGEVLIEATNYYAAARGPKVYEEVPFEMWARGNAKSLRAYIWQHREAASSGAAYAAARFGMGREKTFDNLKPYDVITFNRVKRAGHSTIFIGYLTAKGPARTYSSAVVGFRYFSVQGGSRPDAGFGYRNAYFSDHCPTPRGADDDCGVIRAFTVANGRLTQNQKLLNTGEFYSGNRWKVRDSLAKIKARSTRSDTIQDKARESGLPQLSPDFSQLAEKLAAEALDMELTPDFERYRDDSSAPELFE